MLSKTSVGKGLLGIVLLIGASGGTPITPDQIEEIMHAHNKAKLVDVVTKKESERERLWKKLLRNYLPGFRF